jgi:hypothetical protein
VSKNLNYWAIPYIKAETAVLAGCGLGMTVFVEKSLIFGVTF